MPPGGSGEEVRALETLKIAVLIAHAPWREAVSYRNTWPHEYVLSRKDSQRELIEAVCARFRAGVGRCRPLLQPAKHLPLHRRPQVLRS